MNKLLILPLALAISTSASSKIAVDKISQDEITATYEIMDIMRSRAEEVKNEIGDGILRRDAHSKHHGCVSAEFQVLENLPRELQVGLFSDPGRTYPSWIRFSNASSAYDDDNTSDSRGIALKLFDVDGVKLHEDDSDNTSVDFNLVTAEVFPFSNLNEFHSFMVSLNKTGSIFSYFVPGIRFWEWKPRAFVEVLKVRLHTTQSLYSETYNSLVPFLYGPDRAVRYRIKSCEARQDKIPSDASPAYLREGLVETLEEEDMCFNFYVQFQKEGMDLDDALVRWDERVSPFVKVAKIHIPVQDFDFKEQHDFCEDLSFNPWRTLKEHKPLGSLNRARQIIYDEQSEHRREYNRKQK